MKSMMAFFRNWTSFEPATRVASVRARLVRLLLAYLNRLPPCCM